MKIIPRDRDFDQIRATMKLIVIIVIIKVNYSRFAMVEMNPNGLNAANLGKKRILPSEISHKFSSKEDFLNFFSKSVSLF